MHKLYTHFKAPQTQVCLTTEKNASRLSKTGLTKLRTEPRNNARVQKQKQKKQLGGREGGEKKEQ